MNTGKLYRVSDPTGSPFSNGKVYQIRAKNEEHAVNRYVVLKDADKLDDPKERLNIQ